MFNPDAISAAASQLAAYTLTAGVSGSHIGFTRPFAAGSINPDVPLFGDFVLEQSLTDSNRFFFASSPAVQADTDDSWERTEITGTFSGGTGTAIYIRANRITYTPVTGSITQWELGQNALGTFLNGNVYNVKTFRP